MIKAASKKLSKIWINSGIISISDFEIYCYGLELLLSTVINLLVIIFISVLLDEPYFFIPYLISFIPLRIFAGGFHASSHFFCILFSGISYACSLLIASHISCVAAETVCVTESIISLILLWLYSPVPANNKPLSEQEAKRSREISLFISVALFILSTIFYSASLFKVIWCRMFFSGQIVATFLLTIQKINMIKYPV